jgi:cell division ATPase FtsA
MNGNRLLEIVKSGLPLLFFDVADYRVLICVVRFDYTKSNFSILHHCYINSSSGYMDEVELAKIIIETEGLIKDQIRYCALLIGNQFVCMKKINYTQKYTQQQKINLQDLFGIEIDSIGSFLKQHKNADILDIERFVFDVDGLMVENPISLIARYIKFRCNVFFTTGNFVKNIAEKLLTVAVESVFAGSAMHCVSCACKRLNLGSNILLIECNVNSAFFGLYKNGIIESIGAIDFSEKDIVYHIMRKLEVSELQAEMLNNDVNNIYNQNSFLIKLDELDITNSTRSIKNKEINKIQEECFLRLFSSVADSIKHYNDHNNFSSFSVKIFGDLASKHIGIEQVAKDIFNVHCEILTPKKLHINNQDIDGDSAWTTITSLGFAILDYVRYKSIFKPRNFFEKWTVKVYCILKSFFYY